MATFLIFYANPKGTDRLKLDEEIRLIQDDLEWTQVPGVNVVNVGFVKKSDLQTKIKKYQPVLVQFSGHGTNVGELVLEDNNRKPSIVNSQALERVFQNFDSLIQVVILNCCYSKEQAAAIAKHIPCVIGMRTSVDDQAARIFSSKFLQSLVLSQSVQRSFDLAITELELFHTSLHDVPKLIVKKGTDPEKLIVFPKPSIHAKFEKKLNKLSTDDDYYEFRIMVKDTPSETSQVIYQYNDDERDFERQFDESKNRLSHFQVYLTDEYGDIEIRAVLWGGVNPIAIHCNLSVALENYYFGTNEYNRAEALIKSIRNY